jgi:tRNA(Leu) C34 or U34 (ribose-2'-O)-methylase TrmL
LVSARGFASIGLDRAKDPANLGGVLRAAGCFDASMVVLGGGRMGKYAADTMRAYKHIPCIETDSVLDAVPYGAVQVVVELCDRAKSITNFVHPEAAYYIFGPEDGSVSKHIVERAQCVIQIPTNRCMNLAATVNVVLYDRMLKARCA